MNLIAVYSVPIPETQRLILAPNPMNHKFNDS